MNLFNAEVGIRHKDGGQARSAEQRMLNRLILGFVVFVAGIGCGYAWHMMAG
ncbi:MAG: hypothetical protein SV487_06725 [Thermodesulfobacteriota bacterium]|nr:hypothetical protein [Thermodesulfobacteriota bacterium]